MHCNSPSHQESTYPSAQFEARIAGSRNSSHKINCSSGDADWKGTSMTFWRQNSTLQCAVGFLLFQKKKQKRKNLRLKCSLQAVTVLLGLALFFPSTDAFFDNLIELPMNMAGYMSVARASTECEDQVMLPPANPPSWKSYLWHIYIGGDSSGCDHWGGKQALHWGSESFHYHWLKLQLPVGMFRDEWLRKSVW